MCTSNGYILFLISACWTSNMAKTVKISSTTWKQIDDVLRGRAINVGFALGGGREQLSVAAARNVGSVGIGKNDVVSLTGVLIDSASPAFFEGKYGFTCTDTLSSPDKPCGVALEPIVAGAIGKVAVFGHVAVRVNVTDSSHEFATASETTAGQLVSAESGSFRLVWKSASSGLVWAVAIFPYATGGGIRRAFCMGEAGEGATIQAYLDTDETGKEITVLCDICGGTDLNSAFPRLADGTPIAVWNDGGTWRCLTVFQTSETCS
jgi:hypothetical protein